MSDLGRKDFSTRAHEAVVPDSTKSTSQKVKEAVTGTGDRVARGAQADSSKSTTQSIADHGQRASDRGTHGGTGESIVDKAKNAMGMHH